ncbi:MAG: 3-oxoacyl-ACP reductase [Solirubrobacteraceae bacterium]
MADRYAQLVATPVGGALAKRIGLPRPPQLERWHPGRPVVSGTVLLAGTGGRLERALARALAAIDAAVLTWDDRRLRDAAAAARLDAGIFNPESGRADDRFKAIVLDASGIASSSELVRAWELLSPTVGRLDGGARVVVLGTTPERCREPEAVVAQRALEGLTRSIGKELRKAGTCQLVYVAPRAEGQLQSTLRFLLSPRSAFVSGQVVRIGQPVAPAADVDWERPMAGRVALVTGAARGIGAAIAEVLTRDGAHVVGLDVPAMADEVAAVGKRLGGSSITADIVDASAPSMIADRLLADHGGVDVVVHNAGITRDRRLVRMTREQFSDVIAVNLTAPERIDAELVARDMLRANGRVIGVSSISGIAGNAGQTNYATSKAGVIGLVQTWAPRLAERGVTVNAVAPGFIETSMTAAMPVMLREAGRRLNSLSQGGLPIDVAETVAWLAGAGSAGITGNVIRVCGQGLIGA